MDQLSSVGKLNVSIINEYKHGLGELPSGYTSYISAPLAVIL